LIRVAARVDLLRSRWKKTSVRESFAGAIYLRARALRAARPIDIGPAWRNVRSSDFDKKFTKRGKSLCAKFRTDTLALVTPQDMNHRCEQLVNRPVQIFSLRIILPAPPGASRPRRSANHSSAPAAVTINHFHRSTEGFYATTSLPKLVFPEHALPTAPL
jgi:hypothetical protein